MATSTAAPPLLADKLVAVVGAGIAGLVCASKLAEQGFPVTLFDQGRGPGGRMSQRREKHADGKCYYFDHGAQYFSIKDSLVQSLVDGWHATGCVAEWKGQFGSYDATTRHFSADTALLQQPGLEAKFNVTILKVDWEEEEQSWTLIDKQGSIFKNFWAVVATDKNMASPHFSIQHGLPPPLDGAGIPGLMVKVAGVTSSPCFAVMLTFSEHLSSIPFDGFNVFGSKMLSWAARDSSKPGRTRLSSDGECWVIHSTPEYAQAIIDEVGLAKPSEELLSTVTETLVIDFRSIGDIPAPIFSKAHRWGSAFPKSSIATEDRCLFDEHKRIAICGDFCLGPRVESAILSGLAAAGKIQGLTNADAKL